MTSTFTPNINLQEPATGDFVNTWATPVNANWTTIDNKFGGSVGIAMPASGATTLTIQQTANCFLFFSGALTGNASVIFPASGIWACNNAVTLNGFTITLKANSGDTGTVLPAGGFFWFLSDGTNCYTIALISQTITGALGYTPVNKGGDTMTGALTVPGFTATGSASFAGVTTGALSASSLGVSGSSVLAATSATSLTVSGTTGLGTTTATTVTTGDNSTNVATTAFVNAEITNNLPTAIAAISYGNIGTYIGAAGATGTAPGATVAGSSLSVLYSNSNSTGATPTGTWRYMGSSTGSGFGGAGQIYLRVA